jgi:hypothetical protein
MKVRKMLRRIEHYLQECLNAFTDAVCIVELLFVDWDRDLTLIEEDPQEEGRHHWE